MFEPLARRLNAEGAEVLVTARDNAQTVALARKWLPEITVIGGLSPGRRIGKTVTIVRRARDLARWARSHPVDVALSHNSYAQILAAKRLGIPIVTGSDFEHQPANNLAFRLADAILAPEVVPAAALGRQGARPPKLRRYPGLKEELYLGDFVPDNDVLERVGVERRKGGPIVVARPPPSRAIYHHFDNPLFGDALAELGRQPNVTCILLPRYREQGQGIDALGLSNCTVMDEAVDSRSLMYASDLMLGAGGTMTREAALMGIPTYSLYAGDQPAVDRWLEREGLLRHLGSPAQLSMVGPRPDEPRSPAELRTGAQAIQDAFFDAVQRLAQRG
jgi:predicted glycosyltransferase